MKLPQSGRASFSIFKTGKNFIKNSALSLVFAKRHYSYHSVKAAVLFKETVLIAGLNLNAPGPTLLITCSKSAA